jgi:hypothetical protein
LVALHYIVFKNHDEPPVSHCPRRCSSSVGSVEVVAYAFDQI